MTIRKIITSFDYPPIPIRSFDWSAHWDDYDGGWQAVGHGETEAAAVRDLLEQQAERDADDLEFADLEKYLPGVL